METNKKYTKGRWSIRDLEVIGPMGSNKSICEMTGSFMNESEAKANAARIVECVNGYDALIEENRKLKDALAMFLTGINKSFEANDYYKKAIEFTDGFLRSSTVKPETKEKPVNHFVYKGLTFKDDEETLRREWQGWNKSVVGREDEIPKLTFEEWLMMEDNCDAELLDESTVKEAGSNG